MAKPYIAMYGHGENNKLEVYIKCILNKMIYAYTFYFWE